jgi:hypothetical protein
MFNLPPNQQLVSAGKWPVVGEKAPRESAAPWTVEVCGLVRNPRTYSLEDLARSPLSEFNVDIHCVTRWSRPGSRFRGIPLEVLLKAAEPMESTRFVSFVARSERNHSTSLPLGDAIKLGVFLALEFEGAAITTEHGGPVRTVTPGRYFYKSLKWLERIELLTEERLGYWEAEAGYHNTADPWLEQRYMAPTIDRRDALRLIESRDFSNRDLRSIDASGRNLDGLNARCALLRDADFRKASLRGANFYSANLSNAHLEGAILQNAVFIGADVEGADFTGSDLRGADFTGASLFGATFATESADSASALMDSSTRIPPESIAALTDFQHQIVLGLLRR